MKNKNSLKDFVDIKADLYPFKPTKSVVKYYDSMAKELSFLLDKLSKELMLPTKNMRGVWELYTAPRVRSDIDLFIQIKKEKDIWSKAHGCNPLFMQTESKKGVVFQISGISGKNIHVKTNDILDDEEIYAICKKIKQVDSKVAEYYLKKSNFKTKLLAPNTPVMVTGR